MVDPAVRPESALPRNIIGKIKLNTTFIAADDDETRPKLELKLQKHGYFFFFLFGASQTHSSPPSLATFITQSGQMRFSSWTIKLRAATAGLSNLVCFTAPVLLRGRAAPLYLQRVHLQRQPLRRFSRIRDDRRTAGPGWAPRDRRRGDSGYTRFRPRSVISRGTGWRGWTRKGTRDEARSSRLLATLQESLVGTGRVRVREAVYYKFAHNAPAGLFTWT